MLQSFISWLKGRLPKKLQAEQENPARVPKTAILIDGDQGFKPHVIQKIFKAQAHVDYLWVQNKRSSIATVLKKHPHIKIIQPSDVGKESTDTFIAMETVRLAASGAREVMLVSRDGDFVDVIINAAKMFPTTQFKLMINTGASYKKLPKGLVLPQNASLLRFKIRPELKTSPSAS